MIGSVYPPPEPGLPFLGTIFSNGELLETEAFASEADAAGWVSEMLERIRTHLESPRGDDTEGRLA